MDIGHKESKIEFGNSKLRADLKFDFSNIDYLNYDKLFDSVYFDFNDRKITTKHNMVYLIVYKSNMKYFRDKLKPNRGEIATQN